MFIVPEKELYFFDVLFVLSVRKLHILSSLVYVVLGRKDYFVHVVLGGDTVLVLCAKVLNAHCFDCNVVVAVPM